MLLVCMYSVRTCSVIGVYVQCTYMQCYWCVCTVYVHVVLLVCMYSVRTCSVIGVYVQCTYM